MKIHVVKPLIALSLLFFLPVNALFAVQTEQNGWEMEAKVLSAITEPTFPNRTFNIKDFGAVEGLVNYSGNAINKAVQACAQQGGGTVLVPSGVFYTGPIELKSKV